jgi:pyrimidine-specific ribonucleoside hydrolase
MNKACGCLPLKKFLLITSLLIIAAVRAQDKAAPVQNKPLAVIFDPDMGPDYDDVGAITLLHAFADGGKANILATIASTNTKASPQSST